MCGPSSALKAINTKIQSFSDTMQSEAKSVFGTANGVVNKILGSVDNIINGGPSQAGMSQNEINARNSEVINQGSTMARNLKGAAASGSAAVGGGNVAAPAGGTAATTMAANTAAAEATSEGLNKVQQENYERGNADYWKATDAAEKAPGILATAQGFNQDAMSGLKDAQKSQQEMDTASNWWQPLLEKGAMAGLGMATGGASSMLEGGITNMSKDSSALENVGNFFKGAVTPGGVGTPGGGN